MEDDHFKNLPFSEQKRKREEEVELDLSKMTETPVEKKKRCNEEINESSEHENRDNQLQEDKSAQQQKREEDEVISDLLRKYEKQEGKKGMPKEKPNELSHVELHNRENCHFSEEKSAQKRKMKENNVESDLFRIKKKPVEKKNRYTKDINESNKLSDVELHNCANSHFSEGKLAQKRNMEENNVKLYLFGINEKPVEKKSRSNKDIKGSANVELHDRTNCHVSEEKSSQKRKREEDMEFDFYETNKIQDLTKKRSYEETHDESIDDTQCTVSSSTNFKHFQRSNSKFSSFVIHNSLNMNRSMESSNMENDKHTNCLFSEEKAQNLKEEAQMRKQEAEKRKKEAEKRRQEEKMQEQQIKQMSQKRKTQLAKKLVQDQLQKEQKQKREENNLKLDVHGINEEIFENNITSNKTITGSFVDAISDLGNSSTVSTQHLAVNYSIVFSNDSFRKDMSWSNETNKNYKDDYSDDDKYGSENLSENNEYGLDEWFENNSNNANEYESDAFSDYSDNDQPDEWYEGGFNNPKEYEPEDSCENNEDELDRLSEDKSVNCKKHGLADFSENNEDEVHEWSENESNDSNEYESDDFSEYSEDDKPDEWYEGGFNDAKEYEPDDSCENNEDELDRLSEDKSIYCIKHGFDDFSENDEDEVHEWSENESNDSNEYESDNLSEYSEDDKSDVWYRDEFNDGKEDEAVDFCERNENELGGRDEDKSIDCNKHEFGDFFEQMRMKKMDILKMNPVTNEYESDVFSGYIEEDQAVGWCKDEINEANKHEAGDNFGNNKDEINEKNEDKTPDAN